MNISQKTKRDIVDELKIRDISYNGKLNEIDFVHRLYDLKKLPSNDPRFPDMESDYWQHRINNYDWDYWWIIDDSRLNIINDDERFCEFLCSILHPITRSQEEVYFILEIINAYLVHDGYKVVEDKKVYNGSTFKVIEIEETTIKIDNTINTGNEFVKEQYEKIDKKINEEDFSGVITNSRTLIECVIGDLYKRIMGEDLEPQGNLQDGYKKIKTLLRLSPDNTSNEAFKAILRSFVTIVDGLDRLSNQMSDRHRPFTKAEKNYAIFCANSSKIFVNFLYSVLACQFGQKENLYEQFIKILDGNKRTFSRDKLLADSEVRKLLDRTDAFLQSILKNKLIEEFDICNYRQSDIYFAFLRLFFEVLNQADLKRILLKEKDNPQACGLHLFLDLCKSNKPSLIADPDISAYIGSYKQHTT